MRLGYIKDKNGKLVRKWVKDGEEGKDPNVLYQIESMFGDWIWTDDAHLDEAKACLLEQMIGTIREIAKLDDFWIVKREEDIRRDAEDDPARMMQGVSVEEFIPQEAREGKCILAWKIDFPQFAGYYSWSQAEKLKKQLQECCGQLNND